MFQHQPDDNILVRFHFYNICNKGDYGYPAVYVDDWIPNVVFLILFSCVSFQRISWITFSTDDIIRESPSKDCYLNVCCFSITWKGIHNVLIELLSHPQEQSLPVLRSSFSLNALLSKNSYFTEREFTIGDSTSNRHFSREESEEEKHL